MSENETVPKDAESLPKFSGQCRFCLQEEQEPKLVKACACEGTAARLHPACLVRWQQRHPDRNFCELCRQPWRVPLPPTMKECFVRNVTTAPRYPQPTDVSQAPTGFREKLLARMSPGTLIVQTPKRAIEDEGVRFQGNPFENITSIFAALQMVRVTQHWNKGVFLIVHKGSGDGMDGSDSLVAVNLTRCEQHVKPCEALNGRSIRQLRGGPCNSRKALFLFSPSPQVALNQREMGDILHLHLTANQQQGTQLFHPAQSPNGEVAFQTEVSTGATPSAAAPDSADMICCDGEVAGRINGSSSIAEAVMVMGCAIWSTEQLVAEILRGSWGLCPAFDMDIPLPSRPSAISGLWQKCWQERNPLCLPGSEVGNFYRE